MTSIQSQILQIIYNENIPKHQKLSDILKIILDYCDIDNNKYMIIASYCIRNYREINDLDMNMISDESRIWRYSILQWTNALFFRYDG